MLRNTMKKVINRISLVLLAIGFLISCDSDLTNTNINPNGVSPETANATLVVPNVIHSFTREYSNLGQRNAAGVAQHMQEDSHRSEEHTSELQSRGHLVCRLLLEKQNINIIKYQ